VARGAATGVNPRALLRGSAWNEMQEGRDPETQRGSDGVSPKTQEDERELRYAKLAAALRAAGRILICGMSGRRTRLTMC
jgi:2-keto-3-deoxy-galactonokinase